MPEEQRERNEPVRVFMSYHHSDGIIASTLHKALKEINRIRVKCFLGTYKIKSGKCGYEVGVFSESHGLNISSNNDSRVICLHDVPTFPSIFHAHQNKAIQFPPERKPDGFDERRFYLEPELAKFRAISTPIMTCT